MTRGNSIVTFLMIASAFSDQGPPLDDLKADILKYVLENEQDPSDNRTAIDILQFILGTNTGDTEEEWEVAKQVVDNDPEAPPLPDNEEELNDIIGLYQDSFDNYNEISDTFEDYSDYSFSYQDQLQFDDNTVIQNTFEYADDYTDTDIVEAFDEDDEDEEDTANILPCDDTEDVTSNEILTILDTKSFTMRSEADNSNSATINILNIEEYPDQSRLQCNFTTSSPSLLSSDDCVPEVHLVSGHSSCSVSSLPDTVSARKLAEIHQTGYAETMINVDYEEVDWRNTCLLIVRQKQCIDEGDKRSSCRRALTATPPNRIFSVLSLSSVVVLLSGSSVVRVSNIAVSPVIANAPAYSGLTTTSFNKWDTLPYLQLPGFHGTHALIVAVGMILAYLISAYVIYQYPNLTSSLERWASSRTESLHNEKLVPVTPASQQFLNSDSWGDRLFDLVDNGLYQQEIFFKGVMKNYLGSKLR